MNKICIKCKELKIVSEFYFRKDTKKYKNTCTECERKGMFVYRKNNQKQIKGYKREYRKNNKNKIQTSNRIYYNNNKDKINYQNILYKEKNREKVLQMYKDYYLKNKEKFKEYFKHNAIKIKKRRGLWIVKNKLKIEEYRLNYRKRFGKEIDKRVHEKRKNDKFYKLNNTMSTAIRSALKGNKNGRKWESLVGYSVFDLKKHLERQFNEFMNWNNYGIYWQIDHIIPKSIFKYSRPEKLQFQQCWALNNLRPLEKTENLRKHSKLIKNIQTCLEI